MADGLSGKGTRRWDYYTSEHLRTDSTRWHVALFRRISALAYCCRVVKPMNRVKVSPKSFAGRGFWRDFERNAAKLVPSRFGIFRAQCVAWRGVALRMQHAARMEPRISEVGKCRRMS